jgi:siroheme synthase (precorrin-2 oxidase/ferrochelatase)
MTPEQDDYRDARISDELALARQAQLAKTRFLDTFFERKDDELWDAFQDAPIGDTEALEAIHHQCKSLNAMRLEVQAAEDTGKMAAMEKRELDN